MKKTARTEQSCTLKASARQDDGDPKGSKGPIIVGAPKNIFLEIARSLMDKSRTRVFRYYCANPACPTTFFDASEGYTCPSCGAFGIISEYKNDTCSEDVEGKVVVGCLDSIGRLFCASCAQRHGITNDVSMFVFADTLPYAAQRCHACRSRLNRAVFGVG